MISFKIIFNSLWKQTIPKIFIWLEKNKNKEKSKNSSLRIRPNFLNTKSLKLSTTNWSTIKFLLFPIIKNTRARHALSIFIKTNYPLIISFYQSEGNSFKSFIPARNIWHLRIKQLRIKHSRVTYAINPVNGTPLRHISPSDSDRVLFDACTPAHNTSCCHTTRSSSSSSSSLGEDLRPTSIQDKIRAHLPVMESLFIQYVTSRVKYWNCGGHSSKSWWRNLSYRDFCCDNGWKRAG